MKTWRDNDNEVIDLWEKAVSLKREFNKKHAPNTPNYFKKLEKYIDNKLKKESASIIKEQVLMTYFSLK
ncbi:hypothetical protein GOV12_04485 [Candidatus Pacearchaeota archaeon]|nr:hypothetical protein [Candidatus Pacearchaeota archaeon]